MKSVLISIRPKWVEKIASGKKTIEVRKSAPQEVPFKAYIYCTNGEYSPTNCGKKSISDCLILNRNVVNGKVIGEFICDKVYKWECKSRLEIIFEIFPSWRASYMLFVDDLEKTCLTYNDLWYYGEGKTLYGWHISDFKIYDKPKELSEFRKPLDSVHCSYYGDYCEEGCVGFGSTDYYCKDYWDWEKGLTRPPQSWQYVED